MNEPDLKPYHAKAPNKAVDQQGRRPARFWKSAALVPHAEGFAIALDAGILKTPMGEHLILPHEGLAEAVLCEWQAIDGFVDLSKMAYTRLAFAALDHFSQSKQAVIKKLRDYMDTDLLAYPSTYPKELCDKERALWAPWRAWLADTYGIVMSERADFSTLHDHDKGAKNSEIIRELLGGLDGFNVAGLMMGVEILGSSVLALALWHGAIGPQEAYEASSVGEIFQAEIWGNDEEWLRAQEEKKSNLALLDRYFRLVKQDTTSP